MLSDFVALNDESEIVVLNVMKYYNLNAKQYCVVLNRMKW